MTKKILVDVHSRLPANINQLAPVWVTGASWEDGLPYGFCRYFENLSVRHAADARYIGCMVVTTIVGRFGYCLFQR